MPVKYKNGSQVIYLLSMLFFWRAILDNKEVNYGNNKAIECVRDTL